MRNSNILKWAQSKQNDKGNRNWIHPPDALQKGHIAYLVKFLGNTEVDQPKGIEVVKEGIRKLKFNQQLRKSEGTKTPKVELTISIDGVAIQDPKTNRIIHQYPLHRISYCADDKNEKKFFSFIAKDCPDSERHMCFVFVSDKLAEEITLTIGQAFDLAYKRFLETSGKDLEVQKKIILLQQRIKELENENSTLKQRLSDLLNGQANDIDSYMRKNNISDMLVVTDSIPTLHSVESNGSISTNGTDSNGGLLLNLNSSSSSSTSSSGSLSSGNLGLPPVPPRAFEKKNNFFAETNDVPAVGTKLEGLLLDEVDEDDFNPRAFEANVSPPVVLAPPPKAPRSNKSQLEPKSDPFGMGDFSIQPQPSQTDLENAIGFLDKRILEMKDGFSRGLSFGNDDFSIESLDPLRK